MNATATETVTCPKCFGGRTFTVWSHYAGGRCFRCNGAGVVEASTLPASTDSTDEVKAANLASAEAQRDKAAVSVAEAKRELERVSEMHGKRLAAASELDAARFAFELAQVEQRVQEAAVAQTRAALQQS